MLYSGIAGSIEVWLIQVSCPAGIISILISRFNAQDMLGFHYVASVTPVIEQDWMMLVT